VKASEFAAWPEEPKDVHHPTCNVWVSNDPCSCWHEEMRSFTRLRQDPGPDPNEQVEPAQLPCDDDTAEAS
jgi:hypothetical protein